MFRNLRFAAGRATQRVDAPVFIVGMGRSGTTLLGRILAAHPSVGFLNEPKALWHVVRDDEDIIGSYSPPNTGRLYLGGEDASEIVCRRAHALFAWYLRLSRSERIIDKYPELIFRHEFVRAIFPDARFLIAVRSPWTTLQSVAGWSDSNATDDADWWGVRDRKWEILWEQGVVQRQANWDIAMLKLASEEDHRVRAAVEWVVSMREAILLAEADSRARVVRYEDLVQRPREMVSIMLDFCELRRSIRTESYASAIVSASENSGSREVGSPQLPDGLTDMIDETWTQIVSAHSIVGI